MTTATCYLCKKEETTTGSQVYLDRRPVTEDGTFFFDEKGEGRFLCDNCLTREKYLIAVVLEELCLKNTFTPERLALRLLEVKEKGDLQSLN